MTKVSMKINMVVYIICKVLKLTWTVAVGSFCVNKNVEIRLRGLRLSPNGPILRVE